MEIFSDSTVVSSRRLVSADLGEEVILLHLENGLYFGLVNVGARIWKLLEKPVRVGEIERLLLEEYDVEPEKCHEEVVSLLNKLVDQNLVEVTAS
ncbi:MAG: PqqD family peptide modification chaperone [Gemmatimonadota bacterium]